MWSLRKGIATAAVPNLLILFISIVDTYAMTKGSLKVVWVSWEMRDKSHGAVEAFLVMYHHHVLIRLTFSTNLITFPMTYHLNIISSRFLYLMHLPFQLYIISLHNTQLNLSILIQMWQISILTHQLVQFYFHLCQNFHLILIYCSQFFLDFIANL